jgi:hypothetical protein
MGGADSLYRAAVAHWDQAFRNPALSPDERHHHLTRARDSARAALAADPHQTSVLALLALVLRTLAEVEPDARDGLLREAEELTTRARATQFRSS